MPETYRNFEELTGPEQYAVARRYDGYSYRQIAAGLTREFAFDRSEESIRAWFSRAKNGRLTLAYELYASEMARESSDQAKNLIRRAQPKAAASLVGLLGSQNEAIVHRSAISVLGAVLEAPTSVDEVDGELADITPEMQNAIDEQFKLLQAGREALEVKNGDSV